MFTSGESFNCEIGKFEGEERRFIQFSIFLHGLDEVLRLVFQGLNALGNSSDFLLVMEVALEVF